VNAKTKDNTTPLHLSVQFEHFEIISLLLKNGAKCSKDDELMTPYDLTSNKTIQQLLLNHFVDLKKIIQLKEKGNTLFSKKQFQDAINIYEEILILDKDNFIIYSNLSACFFQLNQWEESLKYATKCVELNSTFVKGYYRMGVALKKMGKSKRAVEIFNEGLKLDQKNEALLQEITSILNE
jgi:tetratricopeptide (TPR) repeat protein